MYYREVMEPYLKDHLISSITTLKEALLIMQSNQLSVLIVVNDKEELSGVLTRNNFLDAYGSGIPIDDSIESILNGSYEIINENEKVKRGIFTAASILIVVNGSNKVTGVLTPEILSRQLLKFSTSIMEKEITTKKILHQDNAGNADNADVVQMDEPCNADYFIDYYEGLTKLIYINKELWDIIEFSSDSIYVTNGEGITVYANDAFEKMTGVPVNTVLGKSVFDAENEGFYTPSISAIVLREKRQVTLIQKGLNGKNLIVTGSPVFDETGSIYMVICNSKDIDELSILKNYLLEIKSSLVKTLNEESKRLNVIYTSDKMIETMKLVNKAAQVDSTVMITGESGTGKGLIARYIHENSSRAGGKMVELNCSAIPEPLFESELFGYESGAFTGANKGGKPGIIEMANKGTLFLDEIGDMPMHMQVKLLKVLQDKQVTRVGALEPVEVDLRIIAATNKDLKELLDKGLLRADLYYRLNVFPIQIAPLRERKEDIYTLLQYFLMLYNKLHNNDIVLTQKAQDKIANNSWPGNVRELEHCIERLVIIKEGIVDVEDLEFDYKNEMENTPVMVNKILPLKEVVDEAERQLINLAMKISQNSYEVADLLEISQASAYRKIKKYT